MSMRRYTAKYSSSAALHASVTFAVLKSQWALTSPYTRSESTAWSQAYWIMPVWSVSSSISEFPMMKPLKLM
uniref:Uncharacterized protein n=1 Tax=Arundo donax TaxID=35708 RepID=A0A0A9FY08_ARUDO